MHRLSEMPVPFLWYLWFTFYEVPESFPTTSSPAKLTNCFLLLINSNPLVSAIAIAAVSGPTPDMEVIRSTFLCSSLSVFINSAISFLISFSCSFSSLVRWFTRRMLPSLGKASACSACSDSLPLSGQLWFDPVPVSAVSGLWISFWVFAIVQVIVPSQIDILLVRLSCP